MKKLFLASAVLAMMLPMSAFARGRGVVVVRPSFGYGFGGYGGYGWGGFYGPAWGYPYGGPYMMGNPNVGSVKIDTKSKETEVFINGHYAGTAGQLKTMNLRPGTYSFELRNPGGGTLDQKVFVIAGKTLKLRPAW